MYRQIATRLLRTGAAASIVLGAGAVAATFVALGSAEPAGALPAPTIYVGNESNNTITTYALPSSGDPAPTSTSTSSTLNQPYGEAFDASGNLWVANYMTSTLSKYTTSQLAAGGMTAPTVQIAASGSSLNGPVGLAFDRSGDLWVANYVGGTLSMFTPAQLATSGSPAATTTITNVAHSLQQPLELAFDPTGRLWVASTNGEQLSGYTPAQLSTGGALAPAVAITGGQIDNPQGIAFDNAGDAWVANEGVPTVLEYTPAQLAASGAPAPAVVLHDDGSGSSIYQAYEIEFDSAGNLWLANDGSNSVSGFSPAQLAASGSPTPAYKLVGGATGLNGPAGLALADPPQAPTNVSASVSGTTATVTWGAPVARVYASDYQVTPVVNGVAQATIDTHSTSTTFSAPAGPGTTVAYRVTASNVFGTGPVGTSNTVSVPAGYWEVGADGTVYPFGAAPNEGDLPALGVHVSNIVGLVPSPDGKGYLLVGSDGGIFAFGDAVFEGSLPGLGIHVGDIVGVVPSPDFKGYLMIGSDGGTFAFGDAVFEGSLPGLGVHVSNVVAVVPSPSGLGYLMIGSDGGTFAFGDVLFHGSLPGLGIHVTNVVGAVPSPDFGGYLMVGSDGGTFAFGDAVFEGSLPGLHVVPAHPVVSVASSPTGLGYLMVGSDGGAFAFGDALYQGSVPGNGVHVTNVVAIVNW